MTTYPQLGDAVEAEIVPKLHPHRRYNIWSIASDVLERTPDGYRLREGVDFWGSLERHEKH